MSAQFPLSESLTHTKQRQTGRESQQQNRNQNEEGHDYTLNQKNRELREEEDLRNLLQYRHRQRMVIEEIEGDHQDLYQRIIRCQHPEDGLLDQGRTPA